MDIVEGIFRGVNEETNYDRLSKDQIRNVNKQLKKLGDYHRDVPIKQVGYVLRKNNIVILNKDGTLWDGMIIGASGRMTLDVGHKRSKSEGYYKAYNNTLLYLSWYLMNSEKGQKRFESIFHLT